ncbi:pyridoxal kinase [Thrips palmi]|uniref:Pyridoxal kinase n=1 Tax=Thrips palmi TaxID=161013 RepID=A0A6P9A245_THRPL|nr:pyridoxal kinase [Thrips palmi]
MLRNTRLWLCLHNVNTAAAASQGSQASLTKASVFGLLSPIPHVPVNLSRGRSLASSAAPVMDAPSPRVLSIQSHVVSGYVGNKSATFPLQVLGFDVDAINSVQFSNHTGYGYWKGQVLAEQELVELTEGLAHNGLDCTYTHLLTGYSRSKSFLTHIANIVSQLRKKNSGLIYLCDPVIGDIGRGIYVPTELIDVYKETIIPIANIVTPNQFELELLTGITLKTIDDVWAATATLHSMGPKTVVISSSELCDEKSLLCLGSAIIDGRQEKAMITFPKLKSSYTGTGDLFSALLLAWMWRSHNNLKQSLEYTVATIQAVLQRTEASCKGDTEKLSVFDRELKLIKSKSDIENPKVVYHAVSIL